MKPANRFVILVGKVHKIPASDKSRLGGTALMFHREWFLFLLGKRMICTL